MKAIPSVFDEVKLAVNEVKIPIGSSSKSKPQKIDYAASVASQYFYMFRNSWKTIIYKDPTINLM